MLKQKIVIVDFGGGNLHSIQRTLSKLGVKAEVSRDPMLISKADKLLLPGVGQFSFGMKSLHSLGIIDVLNEATLIKKKPVLGICLGMQLMTQKSEEGNVDGLGWFDAETVKFEIADSIRYKIPQVGWNNLLLKRTDTLLNGVNSEDYYYFVHSYHVRCNDSSDILALTEYEYSFVSAIQKENIIGVQFHPEKSYEAGEKIFSNFIKMI
jgi:imidazole glycerol-phosphate synthase subunit HisH